MISRFVFQKKQNLDKLLLSYKDIITIQSETVTGAVFGIADQKFAVLIPQGAVFCPLHEVPKLAEKLIPGLREEVMDVYREWGSKYVTGRNLLQ